MKNKNLSGNSRIRKELITGNYTKLPEKKIILAELLTTQLTAEEAEEILISLAHRSAEKRVIGEHRRMITDLGRKLSNIFEIRYQADARWFDRISSRKQPISKHCYCVEKKLSRKQLEASLEKMLLCREGSAKNFSNKN